jgi:hypothetical protein
MPKNGLQDSVSAAGTLYQWAVGRIAVALALFLGQNARLIL